MAKDSLTDDERFELEKQKQARLAKFKMDKHHKIERFGVTVCSLLCCLLALTVAVFFKYRKDTKAKVGDTPIYSTEFTTSLTHNSGDVVDIYRNEKGDKCAVLLKFDSMEGLKTDAKNYQAWVTGWDKYYDDNLSGAIYVYGKSGYMAVCFYSPTGFSNQVVDIIVRSNESIVEEYVSDRTPKDDTSFTKYDQFRIYANLGARKMNVASFFDTEDGSLLDSRKLYDEAILLQRVDDLKAECNYTLSQMEISLRRMDFYEQRLDKQGIQILDRDPMIAGDTITPYDGPEVTHETKISDNNQIITGQVISNQGNGEDSAHSVNEKSTEEQTTEVNEETVKNDVAASDWEGLWKLTPQKSFDGGLDLDWQSYDIFDVNGHFIDKLRGDDEAYVYMNLMQNKINTATDRNYQNPQKWVKKDGSEFVYSSSVYNDYGDDDIYSDILSLQDAYSAYYSAKVEYQTMLLPRFLDLEFEEGNFAVKTSVNADADCINVWHKHKK